MKSYQKKLYSICKNLETVYDIHDRDAQMLQDTVLKQSVIHDEIKDLRDEQIDQDRLSKENLPNQNHILGKVDIAVKNDKNNKNQVSEKDTAENNNQNKTEESSDQEQNIE